MRIEIDRRNLPSELAAEIGRTAIEERLSLNRTAIRLLEKETGHLKFFLAVLDHIATT